jgi:hypothetical protein
MSSFVLCDDSDWEDMYEAESYKWFRLQDAKEIIGHPRIVVYVHEGWCANIDDDRREYLEQQVEILAHFGYIVLVYKSESGREEVYEVQQTAVIESPQVEMFPSNAVAVYETEDNDCEGGSCKI